MKASNSSWLGLAALVEQYVHAINNPGELALELAAKVFQERKSQGLEVQFASLFLAYTVSGLLYMYQGIILLWKT